MTGVESAPPTSQVQAEGPPCASLTLTTGKQNSFGKSSSLEAALEKAVLTQGSNLCQQTGEIQLWFYSGLTQMLSCWLPRCC